MKFYRKFFFMFVFFALNISAFSSQAFAVRGACSHHGGYNYDRSACADGEVTDAIINERNGRYPEAPEKSRIPEGNIRLTPPLTFEEKRDLLNNNRTEEVPIYNDNGEPCVSVFEFSCN